MRLVVPLSLALLTLSAPALAQERCSSIDIVSPAPRNEGARSAASCTDCSDEGQVTITFSFESEVRCGRFVDGQPWVLDEGSGVTITGISPAVTADCGADTCNGWMVNTTGGQALDARSRYDADSEPGVRNPSTDAPFVASAGDSLLKAVSFQDEVVGSDCRNRDVLGTEPRHCLYFAGVLTVLGEAPADGTGEGYFRPPYAGPAKPLIPVGEARLDRLPSLPLSAVEDHPDRERAEQMLCSVPLEFMGTYAQERFSAFLNVDESRGYYGYVSTRLGDYLLRALFEDRTDRMAACLVQRGIDLHHMAVPPVETAWGANGGHGQGRMVWPYLAAALLERSDWADALDALPPGRFAERSQVYWSPLADPEGERGEPGEVLYGAHPAEGGIGMCQTSEYFGRCYPDWPGSCNRVCADPFGLIDGGSPGGSYQQIFSPASRAFALTAHLVPDVASGFPLDHGKPLILHYVDRWVEHGTWAAPDPCDAADPLDDASPAGCASDPLGTCVCNPGDGRYTDRHGTNADGGKAYKTRYTTAVWQAFRSCATDCECDGMDGLCEVAPRPDGGVGDRDAGSDPVDGSTPRDGGSEGPGGDDASGDAGSGDGCGCATAPPPASALPFLLGWLAFRRRR